MLKGFHYPLTPKGKSTLFGQLSLPMCKGEELSGLAPVRTGMGARASIAYVVDDLKTLQQSAVH